MKISKRLKHLLLACTFSECVMRAWSRDHIFCVITFHFLLTFFLTCLFGFCTFFLHFILLPFIVCAVSCVSGFWRECIYVYLECILHLKIGRRHRMVGEWERAFVHLVRICGIIYDYNMIFKIGFLCSLRFFALFYCQPYSIWWCIGICMKLAARFIMLSSFLFRNVSNLFAARGFYRIRLPLLFF